MNPAQHLAPLLIVSLIVHAATKPAVPPVGAVTPGEGSEGRRFLMIVASIGGGYFVTKKLLKGV